MTNVNYQLVDDAESLSFRIIQLLRTSDLVISGRTRRSRSQFPFIRQVRNRTLKMTIQWNIKSSHCLGSLRGKQGDTNTSVSLVGIQQKYSDGTTNDKKNITAKGNRSHATCFQGRCTCLLSRQVVPSLSHLLSRQVSYPLHHWCYTIVVEGLGYEWEVGRERILCI